MKFQLQNLSNYIRPPRKLSFPPQFVGSRIAKGSSVMTDSGYRGIKKFHT